MDTLTPLQAIGIDLGGTKIAVRIFDKNWHAAHSAQHPTPAGYRDLLEVVGESIAWADGVAGQALPVGIGSAGLIREDGTALAANIPIGGETFPEDLQRVTGRGIVLLNDSRALTLSEAVLGVGRGYRCVLGLVIGTGVGGGVAVDGKLAVGQRDLAGEFGHMSASAALVARHRLDLLPCGCGAQGCIETFLSGAGLARIAAQRSGRADDAPAVVAARKSDPAAQDAWNIWCALGADLLRNLILAHDPDCIVLAGGLSQIPDVAADLTEAVNAVHLPGFRTPPILVAEGGAISGARGAALAAMQAM